jgi:hypothetical protein
MLFIDGWCIEIVEYIYIYIYIYSIATLNRNFQSCENSVFESFFYIKMSMSNRYFYAINTRAQKLPSID